LQNQNLKAMEHIVQVKCHEISSVVLTDLI